MSRIADKSVDMILCDLPYGTTACKWDTIIPFIPLWEQYERIIKDNGAIVLTASQPFTSALVMSNPKLFKYCWVWDKMQGGNFLNAKKMPLRQYEDILVFYKKQSTYKPQLTDKEPSKIRKVGDRKKFDGGYIGKTNGKLSEDYDNAKSYPTDIIRYSSRMAECNTINRIHPTQKPVALFEYLIKTYTNEGETVLDNCMGSGTTAIACMNTNRNYIGFEMDKGYFDIVNERIKNHRPQLKLIA